MPLAEVRPMHLEVPVLGHTGRWRFPEKAVAAACWDVRFQLFHTVTFDTLQTAMPSETQRQVEKYSSRSR